MEGEATLSKPQKSPAFSLPISLSLFSGARKEARRQQLLVPEDIGVHEGDHSFL
jgi:hypothetical protein